MGVISQISSDLKTALLAREERTVTTLRLLQSELKNAQITKGEELTESEVTQVIRKEIKKRLDTASLYEGQAQIDRAQAERAEADILSAYLPPAADPAELRSFIETKLAELKLEKTPAAQGTLIKETMAKFAGQTDGQTVSALVRDVLGL